MKIVVIDAGLGNIHSVKNSFLKVTNQFFKNAELKVSKDPNIVDESDKVILPGVGDFSQCKKGLFSIDGMEQVLRKLFEKKQKPFLGICVGMQILAEKSYERGEHKGFGIIKGEVNNLVKVKKDMKIPHMGWNEVKKINDHYLINNDINNKDFYFVHSYHMICNDKKNILATTSYGNEIVAAVCLDNVIGVQFHPEKSQKTGQKFIKEFLQWNPKNTV